MNVQDATVPSRGRSRCAALDRGLAGGLCLVRRSAAGSVKWQDGTSSSLRIGRDRFSVLPAAQEAVEDERLAPPLVQAAAG
jgi:hypothetical protein